MTVSETAGAESDVLTKPVMLSPVFCISEGGATTQETRNFEKSKISKLVNKLRFKTVYPFGH